MNIIVRPGLTSRTFEASDQDQSNAAFYYFGFLTQDGNWIIQRFDMSTTNVILYRYATIKNNSGYDNYADAWIARSSLVYNYFNLVNI